LICQKAVSRLWWHVKNPYAKKCAGTEKDIKPRKIRQLERSGGYVPFPFLAMHTRVYVIFFGRMWK
jgi:hypothetical protein